MSEALGRRALRFSTPDQRRAAMYASIRKYRGMRSVDEIMKRVDKGFVPLVKKLGGFQGYYIMDCGDGTVVSISVFDSREHALASNEKAASWVKSNLADLAGDAKPEITAGEVRVSVSGYRPKNRD
jgi:hypothetical protein